MADELGRPLTDAALLILDLQNDVVHEDGAFAGEESIQHARGQEVVEHAGALAEACRAAGVPVIHVWYVVDAECRVLPKNAGIFNGIRESGAFVRGSWGAEPADGLQPADGDFVVERARVSGWQDSQLEAVLRGLEVKTIVLAGAWTNMSVEHTARTGADKGFDVLVVEDACSSMNAEWHQAAIGYALGNVATVVSSDQVLQSLSTAAGSVDRG
jgi:gluconolactonase